MSQERKQHITSCAQTLRESRHMPEYGVLLKLLEALVQDGQERLVDADEKSFVKVQGEVQAYRRLHRLLTNK